MLKNKKIFITGGLGFIGSAIIQRLIAFNKVIVYDNARRNALCYFPINKHKNLQIIKGDILDVKLLKNSLKPCDIVIHLAAIAGVSSYYKFPIRTMEVNFLGTYNLLNILKHTRCELFLNFSTSEVYGPYADKVKEDCLTTQGAPDESRWTYSVSKLAAEHLTFAFHKEYHIPTVSVRPFNIYGPGQVGEGAIQIFLRNALGHRPLVVTGDGQQVRAWCYIDDLVDAVASILINKKAEGMVFNIGNPKCSINILDLARKIIKITKANSKIIFKKHVGADVQRRIPDIENACRILHFRPKISLDAGIQLAADWYSRHPDLLKKYE